MPNTILVPGYFKYDGTKVIVTPDIESTVVGPEGPIGPEGPTGPTGPSGEDGEDTGGGVTNTPLSNLYFVDGGTSVPTENQNGCILTPFANLQTAINSGVSTFHLASGTYANVTATNAFTLLGMSGVAGPINGSAPTVNNLTTNGELRVYNLYLNGAISAPSLTADGCYIITSNITINNVGSVTVQLTNCRFFAPTPTVFTFTNPGGVIEVDSYTNKKMIDAGVDSLIINGSILVIE